MYGKMHIPRYYERLYTGWRLPLFRTTTRSNDSTRCRRIGLETLLSRKQKTLYSEPNESTLVTLPLSMSTLLSLESIVMSFDSANDACVINPVA